MKTAWDIFIIVYDIILIRFLLRDFKPDLVIIGDHGPYLKRWYITPYSGLFRGVKKTDAFWKRICNFIVRSLPNIYLHKFVHDDPDRAEHCHPWASLSVILTGGYKEIINGETHYRYARGIHGRKATTHHRVVLWRDDHECVLTREGFLCREEAEKVIRPAWTLFFTGPKIRDWGFYCPKGFVPWWDFVKPGKPGEIGRGCGEE